MIKIFSQQNYKQIQLHSREPMPQNTKSDGKTYNPEFLNSLLKSAQTEESDTDWAYLWSHQTEMTASATSIENMSCYSRAQQLHKTETRSNIKMIPILGWSSHDSNQECKFFQVCAMGKSIKCSI